MTGYSRSIQRSASGFAITELVVVLVILSVLLTISTIAFNSWQVKYNVEAQVRQMVTDFSELRVAAMTRKQRHSITLNASGYLLKSYSSDEEALSAGTVLPGGNRAVSYRLMRDAANPYAGEMLEIDQRGMLVDDTTATIYIDRGGSAALNCISIQPVRINPGWSETPGGTCNDR